MTRRLQGNEEKLAVYERRTGAPGSSLAVSENTDENLSQEQQLQAEVAELRLVFFFSLSLTFERCVNRSALKVTEVDLTNTREHVQQYQEIAKASEEALSNISNTFEEYKVSNEAQVARHEVSSSFYTAD